MDSRIHQGIEAVALLVILFCEGAVPGVCCAFRGMALLAGAVRRRPGGRHARLRGVRVRGVLGQPLLGRLVAVVVTRPAVTLVPPVPLVHL